MPCASEAAADCDIGKVLQLGRSALLGLNRDEKYRKEPSPLPSAYPRTRPYGTGAFRQFQPSWLTQYPWLHYSPSCDGAFCRACAFFAPEKVGGHIPGQFVTTPFKSWANKTQKMTSHAGLDYHLTACTQMHEFLATYKSPSGAISTRLDDQIQKQIEENKLVIESLLKITMHLGKQGFAFRGHRDDNLEWIEQETEHSDQNFGNFIEEVEFRAETDSVLHKHLEHGPKNAKYTSKTIQNELIKAVGNHVRSEIFHEIEEAKFYSVIADEVTDCANKEQLSISFRYVFNGTVKEVFVGFVEVERITGKIIADTIIKSLNTWGLPLQHMRGQCYDGASNMSGARSGCSAIIRQVAPMALYHHCAAHRLNLAILSACKVTAFMNTESYIGEMARFFRFSAKRQRFLDRAIDSECPGASAKKLKDACKTRWVQHIDSYAVFMELLPAIHTTFEAMVSPTSFQNLGTDWGWEGDTVKKAEGYIFQLKSPSFLICLQILFECLSRLRSVTIKLQMQAIDVLYAYKQVDSVISSFKSMRTSATASFHRIFLEATQLAKNLHGEEFELNRPRVSNRQVYRNNVATSSPEEYFRITLFNEFLSHMISELEERFSETTRHSIGLLKLMPSECKDLEEGAELPQELAQAANFYKGDLPHSVMLPSEFRMWVSKWRMPGSEIPEKLVDAFKACDKMSYPNIRILLQLALTLPITSCECERSFSQLKLLKTPHRSTISACRLSDLGLMKINRHRCKSISKSPKDMEALVLSFHQMHPRRMKIPFMLSD